MASIDTVTMAKEILDSLKHLPSRQHHSVLVSYLNGLKVQVTEELLKELLKGGSFATNEFERAALASARFNRMNRVNKS